MLGIGIANGIGLNEIPSNIDPAQAFFNATGISSDIEQAAVIGLINELQTNGLWSKMKAIYPFVTDNRNLFSYTENFANGYWTSPMTRLLNSGLAPDGTNTANALVEGNKLDTYLVSSFASINLSPGTHTISVSAKKTTRDWLQLYMNDGTTTRFCWFNLLTGTIGTVQAGATANILDEGGGWYRCEMSMTMSSSGNNAGFGPSSGNGISNYMGNSSTGILAWGAQLEPGVISKYQPIYGSQQDYISNQFKYNLKDPRNLDAAFRLVFNGGWSFFYKGATPSGTNGYADTKLSTSILTNNNTHISYYSRSATSGATRSEIGVGDPATNVYLQMLAYRPTGNYNGDQYYGMAALNRIDAAVANSMGYFVDSRINTTTHKAWRSNVLIGSENNLQTNNISAFSQNIYIGGRNNGGSADLFSDRQTAFATIGDGLTDTEAANLYDAVQNFQTALNRQV